MPRPGRIGRLTLVLVAVMELGLSIKALKPVDQVTAVATCHLVFSLLWLGLGGWVIPYYSVSYFSVLYPRPRTLSGRSALELLPLHIMEMTEYHGFMVCGPWVPCSRQSLGTSD
jgi:hypothetical protein